MTKLITQKEIENSKLHNHNIRPPPMGLLKGYWMLLNHWRRGCWRWGGEESRWMDSTSLSLPRYAMRRFVICSNERVQHTCQQGAWGCQWRGERKWKG